MEPKGRVALITGAGSGIGLATAVALARRGAKVVAVDLDAGGLKALRDAVSGVGGEALPVQTDVTRWDELASAFAKGEERFGGIDIVYNNAGVNTGRPRFPDAVRERWERTIAIDLWAVLAGTQLAVAALRRRGGGVIINTASLAAITPFPADPAYAAAKGGVVALTRSLAFLQEDKIRVVCVCPGMVDTPLLKKRELTADEEDLVRTVLLLRPEEVAGHVVSIIEDDTLHAAVLGLLPGRPPKLIPPQIRFPDDPTEVLKS